MNTNKARAGIQAQGMPAREWVIAALVAVLLTALLQVPYALGYAAARPGTTYVGLLVNVEDANYITIIQRGSEGAWTYSLRFTSEPDAPAFLYVFYLSWGHLGRMVGLDATTTWHAARIAMTLTTLPVAFGFIAHFVEGRRERWTAFLLAALGGGFDWFRLPGEVLDLTSATPIDLKMADAHLFTAALDFPHYLASIALLMILFWCAARLLLDELPRGKRAALLVLGAAANVGVALVYPFFVILSCGVLAVFVLALAVRARRMGVRQVLILLALVAPVVPITAYYAYALNTSEVLRVWAAQSQTLSPNPLHYLLTYGVYLALVLWGARRVGLGAAKQRERRLLLWVWVIVVAGLVYAPLGAQRRFLQGVQVPLAILATYGWYEAGLPRLRATRWFRALAQRPNYSPAGIERLLVLSLIAVMSLSSVYQWMSAVALTGIVQPYPFFRPSGELRAMDWLRANATSDDVVLAAYWTGSYLPLRSGTRTYLGHYYETIHFQDKQKQVDRFFDAGTGDTARLRFLNDAGIRYLFYGRAEKEMGNWNPAQANAFVPVFQNSDAVIYAVQQ